ncbi:DUF362 domain-containing protein [Chloroflexota bacterium]
MIYEASEFAFTPPPLISRARRVLIKPNAVDEQPYPVSTSRETLSAIIDSIKRVSDADIIILEGTSTGESIYPIYKALKYDFPRVLMLDVKDCIWVEVENPLPHPFAVATFWVPNVVISSDYLISITPHRICGRSGYFSIRNLLSLLPVSKYSGDEVVGWGTLYELEIDRVIADLYFTLPFDLGIIDARQKLFYDEEKLQVKSENYNKIFAGEPYEIDREASQQDKVISGYLDFIEAGKSELDTWG